MEGHEQDECMRLVHAWWPSGPWTEDVTRAWLADLHYFEFADFIEGARELHETEDTTFMPPLVRFRAAVAVVRENRERREATRKALMAKRGAPEPPNNWDLIRRSLADVRAAKAKLPEHDHRHGAEGCPVCSLHDHSDTTPAGWTITRQRAVKPDRDGALTEFEHREPVPMWRFSCPRCGAPEVEQYNCSTWSAEGLAFMRNRGVTTAAGEF